MFALKKINKKKEKTSFPENRAWGLQINKKAVYYSLNELSDFWKVVKFQPDYERSVELNLQERLVWERWEQPFSVSSYMCVSNNVPFLLNTSYANKWVSILLDARFCNGRRNLRAWSNGSVTWREEGTLLWEHKRQPGTLIDCTIKKFGACFSFQYLPWLTRLIPTEVL